MKAFQFEFDHTKQKNYRIGILSDLHIDSKHCDIEAVNRALSDPVDCFFINGDTFSCLLPSDKKRFHLSVAQNNDDGYYDYIIDYVAEILKPHADKIMVIGMGNHETSVLKYHHSNPVDRLCRELRRVTGTQFPICGDYGNFIRLKFKNIENNSCTRKLDIFMHHGKGGNAGRSRGMLDWDLYYSSFTADVYCLGHNHLPSIDKARPRTYMLKNGEITKRRRIGLRTGSFEDGIQQNDIDAKYELSFPEERCVFPTSVGDYGVINVSVTSKIFEFDADLINA